MLTKQAFTPAPTQANKNRPALLPLGAMIFSGLAFNAHAQSTEPAAKETSLPAVTVTATKEVEKDGLLGTTTRVGKTLQSPQDIPQAVTTVTDSLMEEQQVGSLREALRNVAGLTFNAAEGGRSGDNMMLRGFYTFGDIYLDGMRDTAQYNRETFYLEQVDVLRGAAAMLFGRGQAGGVINQVSKKPMLNDQNAVTLGLGSYEYSSLTADLNQTVGERSAFRVNLMGRKEESWRSNPASGATPEINREGIAASYAYNIGGRDELLFSYTYSATNDVPDYGMPFDSATHRITEKFSNDTFWGTNANFDDSATQIATITHTHRFDAKTELRTSIRASDYDRAYWAIAPSNNAAPTATGGGGRSKTRTMNYETVNLQSDFTTSTTLAGMGHELLAGVEFLREDGYRNSLQNLGTVGAPMYIPSVQNPNGASSFNGDSYAIYAQDTVEFVPDWKFMLGLRRDQLSATYSSTTSPKLDFGETSVRTGLSWQPNEAAHYYLSYSDSFSPTADLYQINYSSTFPAERSDVVELGAKWLFFKGDLAFRTALYSATKNWERNTDLETTAAILSKKRRTNGIEFELAGRITPAWEVFSGLAFMDSYIMEVAENRNAITGVTTYADPRLQGQRSRNTPAYTFNLWTTYAVGGGWKVGGGVWAQGERYGYNPATTNANSIFTNGEFTPNTLEAAQRWDVMVSYEQRDYVLRLNAQNIFNANYYDSLYDNGSFAVPGTARAFILSGEYKF